MGHKIGPFDTKWTFRPRLEIDRSGSASAKMTPSSLQPSEYSWHLVTGEYPPQHGGVADYTQQLARALADAGERVHVWAPGSVALRMEHAVMVHGLPGFGPKGLMMLSSGLAAVRGRRRVLVQYVASAFGFHGMNLPFAFWVASQRFDEVWIQFHEVAYTFSWRQRPQRNLLAAIEWWMARLAAVDAHRVLISVPGWRKQLGRLGDLAELLPMPSNLPVEVKPEDVKHARERLAAERVIGHFGTYGQLVTELLEPIIVSVLHEVPDVRVVFLGRGGLEFGSSLASTYPELSGRLIATGALDGASTSSLLAACDVLIQPYPDGITGRRTSAMAGLALGMPIVTTDGHLTEDYWARSNAVVLAPVDRSADSSDALIRLLASPGERVALGRRAHTWYRAKFSMERTMELLGVGDGSDKLVQCRSEH
jgi:glycosyltransferase involved in cell wall biosynthesis